MGQKRIKLAAIDIGSNAARIQISAILGAPDSPTLKKIEYIRYPLRLGKDVFNYGEIREERKNKYLKLMQCFKLMVELHEVDYMMAYATSASREAHNGPEIIEAIEKETGILVEVIDGKKEAEITDLALADFIDDESFIHIDVGGGSTELNIHRNGKKRASKSFQIGSVRVKEKDDPVWKEIRHWISHHLNPKYGPIAALGTGGNINKLFQLATPDVAFTLGRGDLKATRDYLNGMSIEDRIHKLKLNEDRADVIVPAADIYLGVMAICESPKILVPQVGLKDGMMIQLMQKALKA
ncbi:phosphatase [Persicobacter diffluens]|uniref:Exopolyphosphatase n=1 Tax=Persicobacter diffluens TaxID=981 RepID=A0AAN4VYU3_9BACT|nr:exopolyphosphatase [Persicobacter diffluens]